MVDFGSRITRELTIRYLAVLGVLGTLALLSFLALARVTADTASAAELVNLAGRQRLLVETAMLAANRMAYTTRGDERVAAAHLLTETLDALEAAHARLIGGRGPGEASKQLPVELRNIYFSPASDLDGGLRDFIATGRPMAERSAAGITGAQLAALAATANGPILAGLDRAAASFQRESDLGMTRLLAVQGGSLVLALGVLLAAGLGIFRPMVTRIGRDIEEQCKTEQRLRDSEERLWRLLDESPVGVSVSRRGDGRVVFTNIRFSEMVGLPREELIGTNARDHYVNEEQWLSVLAALKQNGGIDDAEVEFHRKDGTPFWTLLTIRSTELGGQWLNLAWLYDITERKAAEEQIRLAAKVVDTVNEAVVITNAANEIVFVNPAFTAITDYAADEVMGLNPKVLSSGRHDGEFYGNMWKQLQLTGRWTGEIWNRRKTGEFYAEWLSMAQIRDPAGTVTHHVAVFSDITNRKEDEERVWRQANYDALTGLPNRSLFLDRLNQAVRQCRREGKWFAVMFIDLDGFKLVNDTLGHAAGDLLLQQTAVRMSDCVRASDTVARLAGDEFTIILRGINGRGDAARVAAKILETMAVPFALDGQTACVQASIGVAMFPEDGEDAASLIALADEAMYAVKRQGKNGFLFSGRIALARAETV
jgi:diguanylate cyclase (GGDEF)-like protein/PAS domain S-box-containing protein